MVSGTCGEFTRFLSETCDVTDVISNVENSIEKRLKSLISLKHNHSVICFILRMVGRGHLNILRNLYCTFVNFIAF